MPNARKRKGSKRYSISFMNSYATKKESAYKGMRLSIWLSCLIHFGTTTQGVGLPLWQQVLINLGMHWFRLPNRQSTALRASIGRVMRFSHEAHRTKLKAS